MKKDSTGVTLWPKDRLCGPALTQDRAKGIATIICMQGEEWMANLLIELAVGLSSPSKDDPEQHKRADAAYALVEEAWRYTDDYTAGMYRYARAQREKAEPQGEPTSEN